MSFAERSYDERELFTKASTTSLLTPALDNLTTSVTFERRFAADGPELLFGASAAPKEEDAGATGFWPYPEHKGNAASAIRPNQLKLFNFIKISLLFLRLHRSSIIHTADERF
jgi:hypothetical protein